MASIKNIIIKYKFQLFCILVSFFMLLFTSKNSFFYTFNDWVDANAFFTMGKSIVHGLVPYKDLFEQKGPLLYLIYSLGYLISNKTFYGVFIIEVILFSIFLFYNHKIINYFLDEKYSYIILPILTFIITTSKSFVHGGSCEEYCFPLFSISFYYFIKYFIDNRLTNKEILLNGLLAGCILITKYTFLGFWIGFVILIIIDFLRKKDVKEAFKFCFLFLTGFLIPFFITIIIFYLVGGLKDFIWDYFIINITAYGPFKSFNVTTMLLILFYLVGAGGLIFSITSFIMPLFIIPINGMESRLKINIIGLFLVTLLFIIICLKDYIYYILPIAIFIPISIIGFIFLIKKNDFPIKKYLYIIIFIICIILGGFNANYKEDMFKSKNELFQFKYANYINNFENPTLVNMTSLDVGIYTLTGIVPNTKYFELQNINYDRFSDNIDGLNDYAYNKKVKFLVYSIEGNKYTIPDYVNNNYDLVYEDRYVYEHKIKYARLYQLKGLSSKE